MDLEQISKTLISSYEDKRGINYLDPDKFPSYNKSLEILNLFQDILFAGYVGNKLSEDRLEFFIKTNLVQIYELLSDQILLAINYKSAITSKEPVHKKQALDICHKILEGIPEIRSLLKSDVDAIFKQDPACFSVEEVVHSYPSFLAIWIYRIAHLIYENEVPLIPRIMTEYAHSKTGIDIHPGAKIGKNFFIDHGTGIVIGETAEIADNVKIYQGVTMGSKAPKKGEDLRGKKRHPKIENDVIIYAGATILGSITIGEGSVINGNVWIEEDIPKQTEVTVSKSELVKKPKE